MSRTFLFRRISSNFFVKDFTDIYYYNVVRVICQYLFEKNDLPRGCPWEEPFQIIQFTSPQFQASLLDLWDGIGVFWAGRHTLYLNPNHNHKSFLSVHILRLWGRGCFPLTIIIIPDFLKKSISFSKKFFEKIF